MESATREIVFARRPSGAVRLNIGLGPAQPPVSPEMPSSGTLEQCPDPDESHPLLLLYPFDPPAEAVRPPVRETPEALEDAPCSPDVPADDGSEVFHRDLDDVVIEDAAGQDPQASLPTVKVARRGRRQSRRKKAARRMRLPRVSELEGLWARHGMLLAALIACHAAASYQLAAVYRHFMKLGVSEGSLMPAMFLGLMFASFAIIRLMDGRRSESVAVCILAMTAGSAFAGLLCKVVLIVRGMG